MSQLVDLIQAVFSVIVANIILIVSILYAGASGFGNWDDTLEAVPVMLIVLMGVNLLAAWIFNPRTLKIAICIVAGIELTIAISVMYAVW